LHAPIERRDGGHDACRYDAYRQAGRTPPVVNAGPADYLLRALMEVGPRCVTWQEALAYSQASRTVTEPWEVAALVRLAEEFERGMQIGRSPFGIAPADQAQS